MNIYAKKSGNIKINIFKPGSSILQKFKEYGQLYQFGDTISKKIFTITYQLLWVK